ncbi:Vegetative incompatibility protein HET-E-1-like protein 16 [Colletotrichum musicola]|uniref:Vegetative incompatibility protein HET-E-1-like protein 16 n=1 Tax=Colletotrichum musicola TaxID=2175873 RepID=A0A8H6NHX7_9PEZI|nr:Vegetative incompatibility protein HET-E-1-like protein 16 [Colletotrichum musicola]
MGSPVKMEDYTVGWDPADHNSYALGKVQGHNVAIACLPAGVYGTTSAATVAKDLLRSFRSIRFGLMVGIGGGAPSEEQDIRLGDVVVSQPAGTNGGVIQYGRGKALLEGGFERVGSLNAPPQILLTALSGLQANHLCGQGRLPQFLSDFALRNPKMKAGFGYQGTANDVLFSAEYDHGDSRPTCDRCDDAQTIQRITRDDTDPVVHYGTIASGDQVMKNAQRRDQLRRVLNALCFETEAAGLMQDFPCLVIRGVSDYADSHKNNKWQNYAAVTAAAFAKEILSVIPPARVLQQGTVPQIVSDPVLHGLVTTTTEAITTQTHHQMTRYHSEEEAKCHQSFKTSHPGDDLLWISADPGCGKSVLARSLIENDLRARNHTVCYFFFKDNEEQDAMSTALCGLLQQLFSSQPQLLRHAMDSYKKNGCKLQNEAAELWRILVDASRDDGKTKTATCADNEATTTICVLDALDECASGDRRVLIERLNDFYTHRSSTSTRNRTLKFLVTSRPYQDIATGFSHIPSRLPSIRLTGEESNADISREINLVICDAVERFGHEYQLDGRMQDILRRRLVETPNRTYLWLHLMLEALPDLDKSTSSAFQSDINSLPQPVEEAYERILSRHSGQRPKVEAILHIIVGARRLLKILELYVAYQMATVTPSPTKHKELELDSAHFESHVRHLCGLLVFINDERIFLIHQTAKDFLVARNDLTDCHVGSGDILCSHGIRRQ